MVENYILCQKKEALRLMFKVTQDIYRALQQVDGFKVFTDDHENSSDAWLQFSVKNGSSYRIRFISKDNDNDVSVRVFGLLRVDDDQKARILPALNELNVKYRFVKFCCDGDGDVNVEYDYPVNCISPAASAKEMVIRFTQIIDDAYPVLMRALWS